MLSSYVVMKKLLLLGAILVVSSTTLMAKNVSEPRLEQKYHNVLVTEQKTVKSFKLQKKKLEEELSNLEEIMANKSKMMAKLEKDSEIRWHRDKYKVLLKEYKHYYTKLEEKIKITKEHISELSELIKAM